MHIFGTVRHNNGNIVSGTLNLSQPPQNPAQFDHKSLRSTLSHSVKSLFSRKQTPTNTEDTQIKNNKRRNRLSSGSMFVRSMISGPTAHSNFCSESQIPQSSPINTDCCENNPRPTCRDSETRTRIISETIRKLQQGNRDSLPVTPSSISTGKTLPCFPEEAEYEGYESSAGSSPRAETRPSSGIQTLASTTRTISSTNNSPRTTTQNRRYSVTKPIKSLGSSISSVKRSIRPQSMQYFFKSATSPDTSVASTYIEPEQPTSKPNISNDVGVNSSPVNLSITSPNTVPSDKKKGQRYSVSMSQNLSRRFQTRLAHEYEQRIYCLHSHYSDTIERLESRIQQESERARELESKLQIKDSEYAQQSSLSELSSITSSRSSGGSNLSKRLVEFVEHYQNEATRLTREASIAQEWVITLAELVVGPKKEHQSWDGWLNLCLETLQKRNEDQQEEEWLNRVRWLENHPE